MSHANVSVYSDCVIKRAAPDLMRIEVEKSMRAYEIGKYSGAFIVPRILDYDENKGCVTFEKMQIQPLACHIFDNADILNILRRVGKSLAIIHNYLELPQNMMKQLPPTINGHLDNAWLHGDFNLYNICLDVFTSDIVILDWQMSSLYGGQATYGSRYYDVFWFIESLIVRPRLRLIVKDVITDLAYEFAREYFRQSTITYEPTRVCEYARTIFKLELERTKREIQSNALIRTRLLTPRYKSIQHRLLFKLQSSDME